MTRAEAATYIGVSLPTLDRMVRNGEVRSVVLHARRFFRPADLDELLKASLVPPISRRRGVVRTRKRPA